MCNTVGSAALRASLQELSRLGSPVDLSVADADGEKDKLEITQLGGVHDSQVFELPDGRLACMMALRITNQTSRTIYILDSRIAADFWEDDFFDWLTSSRIPVKNRKKPDTSYLAYRFPGPLGLELPYDQVMNHILLEGQKLTPKRPQAGWLLAVGGPMPPELRHGQWLDATLAIIGSDHSEYTQDIRLWTERLAPKPKSAQPRRGLVARSNGGDNGPAGFGSHCAPARIPDAQRGQTNHTGDDY